MNEVQQMIAESVKRMFADMVDTRLIDAAEAGVWPAALWQAVEESGFIHVLVGQGAEAGNGLWDNALPVLHAIGFYRVPLPLSETMMAHALLAQQGLSAPAGPLTVLQLDAQPLAGGAGWQMTNGRLVLEGVAQAVPWARFARAIVVAGLLGQRQMIGLVDADAPGLTVSEGHNIAGEARDQVSFNQTPCSTYVYCDDTMSDAPVALYGALARAVMMAGAAQSVLEQSVEYANDRVQFGRTIGKFQAIQQSLAVLAGEVASAQSAVAAASRAARPGPQFFDVAVAKIRAGQAASVAANIAHQVHGAICFTYEHSLHYATRRLWSWRAEFGSESFWAEHLGRQAIKAGGAAFWRNLTERQSMEV